MTTESTIVSTFHLAKEEAPTKHNPKLAAVATEAKTSSQTFVEVMHPNE